MADGFHVFTGKYGPPTSPAGTNPPFQGVATNAFEAQMTLGPGRYMILFQTSAKLPHDKRQVHVGARLFFDQRVKAESQILGEWPDGHFTGVMGAGTVLVDPGTTHTPHITIRPATPETSLTADDYYFVLINRIA